MMDMRQIDAANETKFQPNQLYFLSCVIDKTEEFLWKTGCSLYFQIKRRCAKNECDPFHMNCGIKKAIFVKKNAY
jgi:hypothetical protein